MAIDDEVNVLEEEAFAFGAELLMPEADARRELWSLTLRRLVELKQRWKVSIAFLIQRAYECELINSQEQARLYIELAKLPGGRRREPAEFSAEEPSLARKMIESLHAEGVPLAEIAQIMTVKEVTMRQKYLNERSHLRPIREHPARVRLDLGAQEAGGGE